MRRIGRADRGSTSKRVCSDPCMVEHSPRLGLRQCRRLHGSALDWEDFATLWVEAVQTVVLLCRLQGMPTALRASGLHWIAIWARQLFGFIVWEAIEAHSYLYHTLFSCCIFPSLWYTQHGGLLSRVRIQLCAEG